MTGEDDGPITPNPGLGQDHTNVEQASEQSRSDSLMSMNSDLKTKAPILTVAMGLVASAGELLTSGAYLEGGLLMATGVGCIVLYEHQQVKQLPEPVDQEMIESSVDRLAEQLEQELETRDLDGDGDDENSPSPAELTK